MTTRKSIKGLLPSTSYVVRVRAVGSDGVSEWTRPLVFNTLTDAIPPAAPINVSWVSSGDSFHGEWDSVTENDNGEVIPITRYEVELSISGGATKIVAVPPVADGTKNVFDLSFEANRALFGTPKGSIGFRVRAVDNKELLGNWSAPIITATNAVPTTPASITATAGASAIGLTWAPVADTDLVGYRVYVGSSAGFTPALGNMIYSGGSTSFTYTTTTYSPLYFKVSAVDKFGQESGYATSSGVTAQSPFSGDTIPPNTPGGLAATITNNANGSGATASLSWNMGTPDTPPSDLAGFYVRYRVAGSSTPYTNATFQKDDRTGVVQLPSAYTNYEFQIKAFDWSNNESAWSTTVTATAPAATAPAQITGVSSTPAQGTIQYTWTPATEKNVVDYQVDFATNSGFTTGLQTFHTGTSAALTVNGLAQSTTYYMRVRAVNAGSVAGPYSTTDTDTTPANTTLTTVSADIITPGTLGTAGAGTINIGTGATLQTNGGAFKSNTFNGTFTSGVYNNNATAGYYLDSANGLIVKTGKVYADTFEGGTISGTKNIILSGPNAKIIGGSWELSGNGLFIPDGSVQASKLLIQAAAPNLIPAQHSSFELPESYYNFISNTVTANGATATIDTATDRFWHGTQSMRVTMTNTATINGYTEYRGIPKISVQPSKTYIISYYVYQVGGAASDTQATIYIDGTASGGTLRVATGTTQSPVPNAWQRVSYTFTTGASETAIVPVPRITNPTTTVRTNRAYYIDAIMIEEQMSFSTTPSGYNTGSFTQISGDMIRAGAITSNNTALIWDITANDGTGGYAPDPNGTPAWVIDQEGDAVFNNAYVRGSMIVGSPVQYNYIKDPFFETGADGFAGLTPDSTDANGSTYGSTYGLLTGTGWGSTYITMVPGHTYHFSVDVRLASTGSTSTNLTGFAIDIWSLSADNGTTAPPGFSTSGSNYYRYGAPLLVPSAASAWQTITWDYTYTGPDGYKIRPSLMANGNQWLVSNYQVSDTTSESNKLSAISSFNYVPGSSGWTIRSDGFAEFQDMRSNSIKIESLGSGKFDNEIELVDGGKIIARGAGGDVWFDNTGFFSTGSDGKPFISFPNTVDPVTGRRDPNIVSGRLTTDELIVGADNDTGIGASLWKTITVNNGANMLLSGSIQPPGAPVVTKSWPNVPLTMSSGVAMSGLTFVSSTYRSVMWRANALTSQNNLTTGGSPNFGENFSYRDLFAQANAPASGGIQTSNLAMGRVIGQNQYHPVVIVNGRPQPDMNTTYTRGFSFAMHGIARVDSLNYYAVLYRSTVTGSTNTRTEGLYAAIFNATSGAYVAGGSESLQTSQASTVTLGDENGRILSSTGYSSFTVAPDYVNNRFLVGYLDGSGNYIIRALVISGITVTTSTVLTITAANLGVSTTSLGLVGYGPFDFGSGNHYVLRDDINKRHLVFSSTGVAEKTFNWPFAEVSSGTQISGWSAWDPSSSTFKQTNTSSWRLYDYASNTNGTGTTFTNDTDGDGKQTWYFKTSLYDSNGDGASVTYYETPLGVASLPVTVFSRGQVTVSLPAQIPYNANPSIPSPDKARIWVDKGVGTYGLAGTITQPSSTTTFAGGTMPGTAWVAPTGVNLFPSGNAAVFQSSAALAGTPLVQFKGDGTWNLGSLSGDVNGNVFNNTPDYLEFNHASQNTGATTGWVRQTGGSITVPRSGYYMVHITETFGLGTAGTTATRAVGVGIDTTGTGTSFATPAEDMNHSINVPSNVGITVETSFLKYLQAGWVIAPYRYTNVANHYGAGGGFLRILRLL